MYHYFVLILSIAIVLALIVSFHLPSLYEDTVSQIRGWAGSSPPSPLRRCWGVRLNFCSDDNSAISPLFDSHQITPRYTVLEAVSAVDPFGFWLVANKLKSAAHMRWCSFRPINRQTRIATSQAGLPRSMSRAPWRDQTDERFCSTVVVLVFAAGTRATVRIL